VHARNTTGTATDRGWSVRRALLGDWGRVVRDPLDLLRLGFLGGAVAFAGAGDAKGAFNLALAFAVLVAARLANLPRVYDLALIVALAFSQGGEAAGLYDTLAWYDRIVHVAVPLLSSQVLYLCLARLDVLPDPRQRTLRRHEAGMFVVTFCLGPAARSWCSGRSAAGARSGASRVRTASRTSPPEPGKYLLRSH
jgi:hypothetical protein